jgi:hypothetical protein
MAPKKTSRRQLVDREMERAVNRAIRVSNIVRNGNPADGVPMTVALKRKIGDRILEPSTTGLGKRSEPMKPAWRSTAERRVDKEHMNDAAKVVTPAEIKGKVDRSTDFIGSYYGWNGMLRSEYDLQEPFVLVDTEAYLKQAINRKISLMFRSGFEITSEQQRHKEYIERRFATMEYVMDRSMENLFRSVLTSLELCSNCFLFKIRDTKNSTGVKSERNGNKTPIAGYSIIPVHTIFPILVRGKITKWRRFFDGGMPFQDIDPDDIIHLKWDVKPHHIFGTPRTVAVRDDIEALRRLEDNLELLFINHLFPLFHVKIGTPDNPCDYYEDGSSEIDAVRFQIENMPKEGVFVTDDRVAVEVIGAQKHSLEFKELLAHFKQRVYTGLSMSAVDMGEGDTANRATADNISQVLKDSIKNDQSYFSELVRMYIFKELFQESTSSLSIQGATDETRMEWNEVDTDGKIKEENHASVLFGNNLIGRDEARGRMKMKPMAKTEAEKDTMHEKVSKDMATHESKLSRQEAEADVENQKSLANTQIKVIQATAEAEHSKAAAEHKKAEAKGKMVGHQVKLLQAKTAHHKATGGSKKKKGAAATAQSKNTPSNQHGKNHGPTKAKSALEPLVERFVDRLTINLGLWDGNSMSEWKSLSSSAIDGVVQEHLSEMGEEAENSYTRQVRTESDRLKDLVADITDPDLLSAVIEGHLTEEDEPNVDVEEDPAEPGAGESESGDPVGSPSEDSAADRDPDAIRD